MWSSCARCRLLRLRRFPSTQLLLPWAVASTSTKLRFQLKYSWAEREAEAEGPVQAEEDGQQASTSSSDEPQCETAPLLPNAAAWVVTKPKAKKLGCLHVLGRCYRIPGVHYSDWTEVTESVTSGSYDKACRQCFPLGHPVIKDAHLEAVSSKTEAGILMAGEEEHSSSSS